LKALLVANLTKNGQSLSSEPPSTPSLSRCIE
jgi:hypothetical protein